MCLITNQTKIICLALYAKLSLVEIWRNALHTFNRIILHTLLWCRIGGWGFLFLVLGFSRYFLGIPFWPPSWDPRNLGWLKWHTHYYCYLTKHFHRSSLTTVLYNIWRISATTTKSIKTCFSELWNYTEEIPIDPHYLIINYVCILYLS